MATSRIWAILISILIFCTYIQCVGVATPGVKQLARKLASNARVIRWLDSHGMPPGFETASTEVTSFRGAPSSVAQRCSTFVRDKLPRAGDRHQKSPGLVWIGMKLLYSCLTGAEAPDLSGVYIFPQTRTVAPVPLAASTLVIPTVGPTAITNQPRQRAPVRDDWKDLYGAEDVHILKAGHLLSREIRIAGLLSKHSYQDGDVATVTEDLIPFANDQAPGFPVYLDSDDQYDQQAYVWLNTRTRTMYIAFRGSQTYADIMHDFDYRFLDLETGNSLVQGHAGFINKFNSIRAELEEIVDASLPLFNRIIVTGHSLGGALATIAAPVLGEQHPQKFVECITFGSPRIGGNAFRAFYNAHVDSSYRIINESDPVPHLPFHAPFQHVSDAYHITSKGDLVTVPEVAAGQKLLYALMHFDLDHMTETHDLDIYMGRVQSIFSRLWHSAEELLKSGSSFSLGEDELRTPEMSSGDGKRAAITAEDADYDYAEIDVDESTDAGRSTDRDHGVIHGLPDESS